VYIITTAIKITIMITYNAK